MHTVHWKAHLLPLLILSLHSVNVCLADTCSFHENAGIMDTKTISIAADQQTGKDWEPIRIVASAKDLQVPSKYCKSDNGSFYEQSSQGTNSMCKTVYFDTVTAEQKTILMSILEKAIVLHTDRLLVKRVMGPLVIPKFSNHPSCNIFNVPADHHTTGVDNADMVLYVAYSSMSGHGNDDVLSLCVTCAKSAGGRPIAGALIFALNNFVISRHTVRLTAHNIAHALGFSYNEMNSRNMIVEKKVRGKPNPVAVVKSDKTKEMTQAHYGCPTTEGMELEDGEKNNEKLSHWERRNAKDELMATPQMNPGTSFIGFYTKLTMAAFEDMGFYKANFTMAEEMIYGHKAGCKFLTGKCMENGVTKWPTMFCTNPSYLFLPHVCTTDRLGYSVCFLNENLRPSLSSHFQYFTSTTKGGVASSLTDYCPVVEQESSLLCTNSVINGKNFGSIYGKNSMCLDGIDLKLNHNTVASRPAFPSVPDLSAVCAEISCEGGSIKVKYLGDKDGKWHDCPEGTTLTPSSTSTSFLSGKIKCPKYKEVCTVAPDGSSLVSKANFESMEPTTSASPTASQDPPASNKPTGQPNISNSGGKLKDGSSVPFGLIPSVTFLVLSFAGYLIG